MRIQTTLAKPGSGTGRYKHKYSYRHKNKTSTAAALSAYQDGNQNKPVTIKISNYCFIPRNVKIEKGQSISFEVVESRKKRSKKEIREDVDCKEVSHQISFTKRNRNSNSKAPPVHMKNSPVLRLGSCYTVTFEHPGTYEYFCSQYVFMTGNIQVVSQKQQQNRYNVSENVRNDLNDKIEEKKTTNKITTLPSKNSMKKVKTEEEEKEEQKIEAKYPKGSNNSKRKQRKRNVSAKLLSNKLESLSVADEEEEEKSNAGISVTSMSCRNSVSEHNKENKQHTHHRHGNIAKSIRKNNVGPIVKKKSIENRQKNLNNSGTHFDKKKLFESGPEEEEKEEIIVKEQRKHFNTDNNNNRKKLRKIRGKYNVDANTNTKTNRRDKLDRSSISEHEEEEEKLNENNKENTKKRANKVKTEISETEPIMKAERKRRNQRHQLSQQQNDIQDGNIAQSNKEEPKEHEKVSVAKNNPKARTSSRSNKRRNARLNKKKSHRKQFNVVGSSSKLICANEEEEDNKSNVSRSSASVISDNSKRDNHQLSKRKRQKKKKQGAVGIGTDLQCTKTPETTSAALKHGKDDVNVKFCLESFDVRAARSFLGRRWNDLSVNSKVILI